MEGFLLIDKPAGMTSHDVVDAVRKLTGERKVGHAGTLDPFATGLLILGVGKKYTKQMSDLVGLDKEYEATYVLGSISETHDPEGPITKNETDRELTPDEIEATIKKFTGKIKQIPPMHAAIKKDGKKLYELARAGEKIEREARPVNIYEYELLETSDDNHEIKVRIKCSSGTYIRALARDLGRELGVGAYVSELRRTKIGEHMIEQAKPLVDLTPENIAEQLIK